MMETLAIYLAVGVAIVNICLLLALLYIYAKTYKVVKTGFTKGLLVFATFLLIQNIGFTGLIFIISELHGPRPGCGLFFIKLIEMIAYAILLKTTWE